MNISCMLRVLNTNTTNNKNDDDNNNNCTFTSTHIHYLLQAHHKTKRLKQNLKQTKTY